MKNLTSLNKQSGLAVVVAMLVLIALTLIVLSGSRNTTMQLRMASNLESRVDALEKSQGGLDYGFYYGQTQLRIADQLICTSYHPDTNCTNRIINLPAPLDDSASGPSNLLIEKTGGGYEEGTSVSLGKKNYFRVESTYDNRANGQGRTKLVSGIKLLEFTPE